MIQKAVFNAISGLFGSSSNVGEAYPDQDGASNMVALYASFTALVLLNASELFQLAVELLDFPAHATHLLCGIQRILSEVVSDNPIRAVGRHRDPEQFYLVVLRKPFDFDDFAMLSLLMAPRQRIHPAVQRCTACVINLSIVLQWAVVNFLQGVDE